MEKLDQCHNLRKEASVYDCDNERCASTEIPQIGKNQLIELREHLERCFNVLHVFGFSSTKYVLNLIKLIFLPSFVNKRNIELTVIKKTDHYIFFKLGDN